MEVKMIYGDKMFIKAHKDRTIPYFNHSYDRYVRDVLCYRCARLIGEQQRYPDFEKEFHFGNEKDKYIFCPYCGHKFKK